MRIENDHCDVIGVPAAPTQLDDLSSAILQQRGVARVSLPGDVVAWAAGRHQTLRRMLSDQRFNKDWRQWRALQDGEIPEDHPLIGMCKVDNMATAHGADHRRLRGLLSSSFAPSRIALLAPRIQQRVDQLLAEMAQRGGSADLMCEFAVPLPTNVIAELFGLPDEQREEIVALTYSLASTSATAEEVRQTRQRIPEFFRRLIALKRRRL
ncbi:MAG: cytochrome P450, partial [Mesorhizobium sp.]